MLAFDVELLNSDSEANDGTQNLGQHFPCLLTSLFL